MSGGIPRRNPATAGPEIVSPGRNTHRASFRVTAGLLAASAAVAVTVLHRFPPDEHGFYPRCVLNATTGLMCPGCGTLRAFHQVLNGEFSSAFRLNPLLFLAGPVILWALVRSVLPAATRRHIPAFTDRPWLGWTMAGLIIGFGVARNLPFPF